MGDAAGNLPSYQPPLRARLHRYKLASSELVLLQAMCEHCSSGETIWASVPRLAAYSKLHERTVQKLLRGLLKRRILRELAPANREKRRPATYAINEAALPEDPRVMRYLARQKQYTLPNVRLASVPGEPVPDQVALGHQDLVAPGHLSGGLTPPDSTAVRDSKTKAIHHGDAAMMPPPAGDPTLQNMPAWLAFKEQLRSELSPVEWDLWVRPMFLAKVNLDSAGDGKHFRAALPRNSKIQAAALNRLPLMRELLAPARVAISLAPYPDEYEISEAQRRYGKDVAPKPWTRKGSA